MNFQYVKNFVQDKKKLQSIGWLSAAAAFVLCALFYFSAAFDLRSLFYTSALIFIVAGGILFWCERVKSAIVIAAAGLVLLFGAFYKSFWICYLGFLLLYAGVLLYFKPTRLYRMVVAVSGIVTALSLLLPCLIELRAKGLLLVLFCVIGLFQLIFAVFFVSRKFSQLEEHLLTIWGKLSVAVGKLSSAVKKYSRLGIATAADSDMSGLNKANQREKLSEENSNVSSNAGDPANADATTMGTEKINPLSGKVDGFVERLLGVIGNRPWEACLDVGNRYVTKFLPGAIALAGVLACVLDLFQLIKHDAPFSKVLEALCILIPVAFSMYLAPKALALTRSLIAKSEAEVIRPELMDILKVLLGLGGLLLGAYLLLNFDSDLIVPAIIAIAFAVLMIICLERPGIVGIKAGYPTNCVEEVIALVMFPVRVIVALITPLTGMLVVCGIVYGVVRWVGAEPNTRLYAYYNNYYEWYDGYNYYANFYAWCLGNKNALAPTFKQTVLIPFLLPLAVYLSYLVSRFTIDLFRAIASIPRKLDELKAK